MDSKQIKSALKNYKNFVGVFPIDQIPKIKKYPSALIVNTDPSTKPGEHWVAIYVNKDNTEYFDSFGLPPFKNELINFLFSTPGVITYNTVTLQSTNSDTCGKYCIMFIKNKLHGYSFEDMLSYFTRNTFYNDLLVDVYTRKV